MSKFKIDSSIFLNFNIILLLSYFLITTVKSADVLKQNSKKIINISENGNHIVRGLAVQPSLSRLLGNSPLLPPRTQFENFKASFGETIRLECPQPNPTWFFRRTSNDDTNRGFGSFPDSNGQDIPNEEIIVTRHGVVTAAHKYKIMCHPTHKHKIIIISDIGFEQEGLYTCLYTQPAESSGYYTNSDGIPINEPGVGNIQFRYVFNVTVFTQISGLTMSVKPISMKLPLNQESKVKLFPISDKIQPYESESIIAIKENDEIQISCIVESSKPAADIKFSITNSSPDETQSPSLFLPSLNGLNSQAIASSLVTSSINTIKNSDKTIKTIFVARLKANLEDNGKIASCKAENGFGQKWENKKSLNIKFAPVCKDPPNFVYYVGVNQTVTVECRIFNANPNRITYDWNLDNLNINVHNRRNFYNDFDSPIAEKSIALNPNEDLGLIKSFPTPTPIFNNQESIPKFSNLVNEGLSTKFNWRPNSLSDFGEIKCKASNEIGSAECIYEIKLGGAPNPPTECSHTLKNTSAIISCQVGFHQGDPDIYCYLLRKSDNGVYKEHTRNRESCSFIVNDVNVNKLNEFWIYSSNKHGHNKDNGVHLTIGQNIKPIESNSSKTFIIIGVGSGAAIFLFLICCFCFKIKKGFSDDNDSIFESDTYQPRNGQTTGLINGKKNEQMNKMIKGVKVANHNGSYDINDHIKEAKKTESLTNSRRNSLIKDRNYLNDELDTYLDKKRAIYENPASYLEYTKLNTNIKDQEDKSNKFSIFKTSSTLPLNKTDNNHIKIGTMGTNNSLNRANSLKLKKSISFTKTSNDETLSSDDPSNAKESTPLFNNDKKKPSGLLTTVTNNSIYTSKNEPVSTNSLNDSNLIQSNNKMVTFGSSTHKLTNPKTNQSITTLTTALATSTGSSSGSSSSTGSTTSPSTSTTNNDSELTMYSPLNENPISHSFTLKPMAIQLPNNSQIAQQRPKLTAFTKNNQIYSDNGFHRSPKHLIQSTSPDSKTPSEVLEAKFLNKLCEEIEVSLNVDCECADDYSSNDFSGDYSFDNDIKSPSLPISVNKMNNDYSNLNNNLIKSNLSHLTDLRRNFEINIKQLRSNGLLNSSSNNSNSVNGNFKSKELKNAKTNVENEYHHQQSPAKNQLGVLV